MHKLKQDDNAYAVSDIDGAAKSNGGLFDGFEAYKTPTEADYARLLAEGIVVPDANVFLNLYRYNEQTRNDLLAVFRQLGDRLWVPHQVIVEFWRNRETVLQDPRATTATLRDLEGQRDKAVNTLRLWANRVSLPHERRENLLDALRKTFQDVGDGVRELADNDASEFARDTNKDPVILELVPVLSGRVGPAFDQPSRENAIAEAKSRLDAKKPPGFKDSSKELDLAVGDCFIWFQTIRHARSEKKDVLFVTGDVKEDWWRREHGESRGPLPELVNELREQASVQLYMLRTESMILRARQAFDMNISDESVQDIERIDQLTSSVEQADASSFEQIRARWSDIVESMRDRRKVAWILLSSSVPVSLDSDTLTVEFPREGDAKGFMSSGCDNDLSAVVEETTNLVCRIRTASRAGIGRESESRRTNILAAGDLVNHDSYGLGRIISVEGRADDPEAKIDFGEEFGVKHLLLRYAPIERL